VLVSVAIAVLAVLVALVVVADDDDDVSTSSSTTTPVSPTSGTTSTSTTTATPPAGDTASAVWPDPDGSVRYDDPAAAASGFATEFVGFVDRARSTSGPAPMGPSRRCSFGS
jgi:hypothetical protein